MSLLDWCAINLLWYILYPGAYIKHIAEVQEQNVITTNAVM